MPMQIKAILPAELIVGSSADSVDGLCRAALFDTLT
jgi:hypothetical protein